VAAGQRFDEKLVKAAQKETGPDEPDRFFSQVGRRP
jgi:hypothetical protein